MVDEGGPPSTRSASACVTPSVEGSEEVVTEFIHILVTQSKEEGFPWTPTKELDVSVAQLAALPLVFRAW